MTAVARGNLALIHTVHQLHTFLDYEALFTIINALVTPHFDYCNSLYIELPLKATQNAVTCSVLGVPSFICVQTLLHELH